jgi:4-carboxymuconolactone decarboxylase
MAQMRLDALPPAGLTPEQRALYDAVLTSPRKDVHLAEDGSLKGPFNALLYNPAIGLPLQRLGSALRYEGLLPPRARELAILTVAAAFGSNYEWYAHVPIAESAGITEEQIQAIRRGGMPDLTDAAERAVVSVARAQLARDDIDDAAYEAAASLIGAAELVELTTLVGYYGILAVQMQLFRVPLPAGAEPAFG